MFFSRNAFPLCLLRGNKELKCTNLFLHYIDGKTFGVGWLILKEPRIAFLMPPNPAYTTPQGTAEQQPLTLSTYSP